jgi:hypothetical protein
LSTIEDAIYGELSTRSEITGLASDRTYPHHLPQNPTYPAQSYRTVTSAVPMAHDGPGDLVTQRIQFDHYGRTAKEARSLARAVRSVLNGFRGTLGGLVEVHGIFFLNEVSDFGGGAEVHRTTTDFKFVYKEE